MVSALRVAAHNFDVAHLVSLSVDVAHVLLKPFFKDRGGHSSPD